MFVLAIAAHKFVITFCVCVELMQSGTKVNSTQHFFIYCNFIILILTKHTSSFKKSTKLKYKCLFMLLNAISRTNLDSTRPRQVKVNSILDSHLVPTVLEEKYVISKSNLKNLSGGLNLSHGLNMVGSI